MPDGKDDQIDIDKTLIWHETDRCLIEVDPIIFAI